MGSSLVKYRPRCICLEPPEKLETRYHMDLFGDEESVAPFGTESICPDMTREHVQIVSNTWPIVQQDAARIGTNSFIGVFDSHTDMQEAFSAFKGLSKEAVKKRLKSHGFLVLDIIGEAVHHLQISDNENFTNYIKTFGVKHSEHVKNPEYLDIFIPEFLGVIQSSLYNTWTREVESAWLCFLQVILFYMKEPYISHPKSAL